MTGSGPTCSAIREFHHRARTGDGRIRGAPASSMGLKVEALVDAAEAGLHAIICAPGSAMVALRGEGTRIQ